MNLCLDFPLKFCIVFWTWFQPQWSNPLICSSWIHRPPLRLTPVSVLLHCLWPHNQTLHSLTVIEPMICPGDKTECRKEWWATEGGTWGGEAISQSRSMSGSDGEGLLQRKVQNKTERTLFPQSLGKLREKAKVRERKLKSTALLLTARYFYSYLFQSTQRPYHIHITIPGLEMRKLWLRRASETG